MSPSDQSVKRTPRNLILLTLATSGQVVIQFFIQVVVAYLYGARADADALAAALAIPTLMAAVISGSLSYVLVPEMVACFEDQSRASIGWRLAGLSGLIASMVALFATIAVVLFSRPIIAFLYRELPPELQTLASHLLEILAWQILMSTLMSWSLAVHHSRHSFVVPAIGGVIGTSATLGLAYSCGGWGIDWIARAINVGALISAAIHVAPYLTRLRLGAVPRALVTRLLWAIVPLILGSVYLRIDPVVDRSLASQLSEGSVAQLHYAQRIIIALLAVSTSGLSVIAFPQFANRLSSEGLQAFIDHFALATRRLILLTVPIAMGFSIYAVAIIGDLLEHGQFTSSDSWMVGNLIVCLMGMFVGASWSELLARGFYTLGDTRTPTLVGVTALSIGLAAKWTSLPYLKVWGIAGGTSLYVMLAASSMAFLLLRKTNRTLFAGCFKTLVQSAGASLIACGACWPPYGLDFGRTLLAAPVGGLVYLGVLACLGNQDARMTLRWLKSKALGRPFEEESEGSSKEEAL